MKHVSNSKKNFDSAKRQTLKSHRLTHILRHDKKRPVVACCHRFCSCSVVCMHDICNLCWTHNLFSSNEHRYNSKFWMKSQIHQLKTGSQNKTKTKEKKDGSVLSFFLLRVQFYLCFIVSTLWFRMNRTEWNDFNKNQRWFWMNEMSSMVEFFDRRWLHCRGHHGVCFAYCWLALAESPSPSVFGSFSTPTTSSIWSGFWSLARTSAKYAS